MHAAPGCSLTALLGSPWPFPCLAGCPCISNTFLLWPCSVDVQGTFEAKGVTSAAQRLQRIPADVMQPFPQAILEAGVDTLLMKHFLSAFSDSQADTILKHCAQALSKDGKLLLMQVSCWNTSGMSVLRSPHQLLTISFSDLQCLGRCSKYISARSCASSQLFMEYVPCFAVDVRCGCVLVPSHAMHFRLSADALALQTLVPNAGDTTNNVCKDGVMPGEIAFSGSSSHIQVLLDAIKNLASVDLAGSASSITACLSVQDCSQLRFWPCALAAHGEHWRSGRIYLASKGSSWRISRRSEPACTSWCGGDDVPCVLAVQLSHAEAHTFCSPHFGSVTSISIVILPSDHQTLPRPYLTFIHHTLNSLE